MKFIPAAEALANACLMAAAPMLLKLAHDYRKLLTCLLADPEGRGDIPALMRRVREVNEVLEKVKEEG